MAAGGAGTAYAAATRACLDALKGKAKAETAPGAPLFGGWMTVSQTTTVDAGPDVGVASLHVLCDRGRIRHTNAMECPHRDSNGSIPLHNHRDHVAPSTKAYAGASMRVLIATDAWHPQMNGVVRTLHSLQHAA